MMESRFCYEITIDDGNDNLACILYWFPKYFDL